jgi:hypothetical protein
LKSIIQDLLSIPSPFVPPNINILLLFFPRFVQENAATIGESLITIDSHLLRVGSYFSAVGH